MESPHNKKMKGVILAGGMGTRLRPLTYITNKHLLPVYDKPMVLYPLDTLKRSGITDIVVISGKEHAGDFMNFLGSGKDYGVNLSYAIQDKNNGGIADALACARQYCDQSDVAVILGDNIFVEDFAKAVAGFAGGASIFLKKVDDPARYGVPVFNSRGDILRVEEKPKRPKSNYAQAGMYLLDSTAFERAELLKPSARGELEMTDLINMYVKEGRISHHILKREWYDAGTVDSLLEAANCMKRKHSHV